MQERQWITARRSELNALAEELAKKLETPRMKKTRVSLAVGAVAGVLLLGALAANASADEAPRPADRGQAEKAAVPPAPPTPEWVSLAA